MSFKTIMIPYDGSKYANKSFRTALEIAKKFNSSIKIFTCIQATQKIWFMGVGYDESVAKKHKVSAKKDLLKLKALAEKNGIKASCTISESQSILKPLLSFAKSRKVDLIVMGSHGRTGLDKFLLGSVANGVIQHAKCPVLIIKK